MKNLTSLDTVFSFVLTLWTCTKSASVSGTLLVKCLYYIFIIHMAEI